MAITIPGDDKRSSPTPTPAAKSRAYQAKPVQPVSPNVHHRTDQQPTVSSEEQRRYEATAYPHLQPVDNFAMTRNTDRSRDYAIACSDDGFSNAHARYASIVNSNSRSFEAFPGVRNALEFLAQSQTHSFRDVFLDAIDSRTTYYSNDYKADMPAELTAELCRVTGYSAHLNARVMYETVKIYDDFTKRMDQHRQELTKSQTLKAATMPASSSSVASDSTNQSTATQDENMNNTTAPADATNDETIGTTAAQAEVDSTAPAADTKPRFSGGRKLLDKSTVVIKKAADGVAKATVVASTAIVVGELALFTYRSMRGQDYMIGDGLRAVGGLFVRKVIVVENETS